MSDYSALFKMLKVKPRDFFSVLGNDKEYHFIEIPKKNGDKRKLSVPSDRLAKIQRRLLYRLEEGYLPTKPSHGFTSLRSVKTNASLHVGKDWVLNLDIEDFFPTITERRVWGALIKWKKFTDKWKLSKKEVFMLAKLCCLNGNLPQGSPTSPFLSNLVCRRLDWQLGDFAKSLKLVYSRYCDDISLSPSIPGIRSNMIYHCEQGKLDNQLSEIFKKNDFSLNEDKIRLFTIPRPLRVTGLVVNNITNLPRGWIRNLRAMLHDWETNGEQNATERFWDLKNDVKWRKKSFSNVVLGKIQYLSMIRGKGDPIYLGFRKRFIKLNREAEQRLRVNLDDYSVRGDLDALIHEDLIIRKNDQNKGSSFLLKWAKMRIDYLCDGLENIRKEFLGEHVYQVILQAEKLYLINEMRGISDQSDSFTLFKRGWDRLVSRIGDECGRNFSKLPFHDLEPLNGDLKQKLKDFWKSQDMHFKMSGSKGTFKSIFNSSSDKGSRGQGFPALILFLSLGFLNGDLPVIGRQKKRIKKAFQKDQYFGQNFNRLRVMRNLDKRRVPEIVEFRPRFYNAWKVLGARIR